jgi:DNA-binding beta-propeller fold protein YncE
MICPPVFAQTYERSVLVRGIANAAPGISPHGITGVSFGPDGYLYAGSVIGPGVYRIDVDTGAVSEVVGAPDGESDDVAVAADGTLVWTALIAGELRRRSPNGTISVLAKDLPRINPVTFTTEGRLFTGQFGQPDSLIEIDLAGKIAPRFVATDLGGINAFVDDGQRGDKAGLFVPLADKGAVGRVNLKTGALAIIATDLGQPVAVKRDSRGGLVTIDWQTGKVSHVNPISGEATRITVVAPPLDNLAVGPDDTIYVSRPSDNSIIAVHPTTGAQRPIVQGALTAPGGLAFTQRNGKPALIISDAYGYRFADPVTGIVETPTFKLGTTASSGVVATERFIVISNVRRPSVTFFDRTTDRVVTTLSNFKAPMSLVVSAKDEVYLTDYNSGEVLALMPGATPDRRVVASGLDGPVGLAIDGMGALVVSEAGSGILSRIDSATGLKTEVARGLNQPEGLAVLPNGMIAVAETGLKRLVLVNAKTGVITPIAQDLPIGQVFTRAPAPVFLPTGVVADADGAIYVTCDRDNTVLRFKLQERSAR